MTRPDDPQLEQGRASEDATVELDRLRLPACVLDTGAGPGCRYCGGTRGVRQVINTPLRVQAWARRGRHAYPLHAQVEQTEVDAELGALRSRLGKRGVVLRRSATRLAVRFDIGRREHLGPVGLEDPEELLADLRQALDTT